jgi:hypothetical protein
MAGLGGRTVAKRWVVKDLFEFRPDQTIEEAIAEVRALIDSMEAEEEARLAGEREAARAPLADPAPDSSEALSIGSPAPNTPEA